MTRRWGFDQGFAEYDERAASGAPQRPVASRVVDSVVEWLSADQDRPAGDEKPFFAWLHIFDPHWNYAPPAPYDTQFDPDYVGSMSGDYRSIAPFIKESVGYETPPPLDPKDLAHLLALYDGEIAYVDAEIGRLFDHLRESDVYDDTLIVVTSDHGEEFMEHGSLEGHQWTLYEEVIRVPLMMRLPERGCRSGKRRLRGVLVEETVSTVGIAGTILDCVGIERDRRPTLNSLVEGESSFSAAVGTLLLDLTVRRTERIVGLRTDSHKLIVNADGSEEFFVDPGIGNEISGNGDAESANRMRTELKGRLERLERLSDAGAPHAPLDSVTVNQLRATGYID